MQIISTLKNKAQAYEIKKTEQTLLLIKQTSSITLEDTVKAIVVNLIERKEFQKAKEFCNSLHNADKKSKFSRYIANLENDIAGVEMGEVILAKIKEENNEDEEFIEKLEKWMRRTGIPLTSIILGKSKDGKRKISLASIWETEEKIK